MAGVRLEARDPLEACKAALARVQPGPETLDWQIPWVATVALLRSVGYVLKEVDGQEPVPEAIIDHWWKELNRSKSDQQNIFWHFIDCERHLLLKKFRIRSDVEPSFLRVSDRGPILAAAPGVPLIAGYRLIVQGGPFAGQDACELANAAVAWWEHELSGLEARIAHGAKSP